MVLLDRVICLLKTEPGSKVHFHRPLKDNDILTTSATAELGWMWLVGEWHHMPATPFLTRFISTTFPVPLREYENSHLPCRSRGVPVGKLWHIIFPLEVTSDSLQHIYRDPTSYLDLFQWITNTLFLTSKMLLLLFWLQGKLSETYCLWNIKVRTCDADTGKGERGKK